VHRPLFGPRPLLCRGSETVNFIFYEVRMSAPQPTTNLDGQIILLLAASGSQPVPHVWPYRQLPLLLNMPPIR
jgi:hypothetical protein